MANTTIAGISISHQPSFGLRFIPRAMEPNRPEGLSMNKPR
jgi:hypothetical protein